MSLAVSDNQVVRFERGFKSWAENTAVTIRTSLGTKQVDPIVPLHLAKHLGVRVWMLSDVPGLPPASLSYLSSTEGDEWSALAVCIDRKEVVVLNPSHSPARQNSDLAHELAHLIRQHEPAQIVISEETGIGLRTFHELQEAEANWLAGCLLLPRPALSYCAARGMRRVDMCDHFGVSTELLRYRLGVTGVGRQFNLAS
jgi:hypothetical protein